MACRALHCKCSGEIRENTIREVKRKKTCKDIGDWLGVNSLLARGGKKQDPKGKKMTEGKNKPHSRESPPDQHANDLSLRHQSNHQRTTKRSGNPSLKIHTACSTLSARTAIVQSQSRETTRAKSTVGSARRVSCPCARLECLTEISSDSP